MALLEIEPITDIIKLVLQTGYIKHTDTPVNLLLIAKPGSAKTSAMAQFKIKGTYTTNNITQAVIVSDILPKIENQGLKHLIIPDLLNAIKKDYRTKEGFLQLLKTLIEEGITSLDTFHMRTGKVYNPPIKCGVITAITSESYVGTYNSNKQRFEGGLRHYWKNIGLLSRFIPFSYEYELSKIQRIFQFIQNEEHLQPTSKQKINRKIVDVKGNPQLFQKLEILSVRIAQESGGYGFRPQRSLQTLAKASAALNGRTELTQQDIDKILELGNWMNKRFNPL